MPGDCPALGTPGHVRSTLVKIVGGRHWEMIDNVVKFCVFCFLVMFSIVFGSVMAFYVATRVFG